MSWLALMVVSRITMASSNISKSLAAKSPGSDPLSLTAFYYLISYTVSIVYCLLFLSPSTDNIGALLPLLVVNSTLFPLGHVLTFMSLKLTDVSLQEIISAASTIYTILLASIFLSETIAAAQWIGLSLILLSTVYVKHRTKSSKSKNMKKGIMYALIAAAVYGVAVVNGKVLFDSTDLGSFLVLGAVPNALVLLLGTYIYSRRKHRHLRKLINKKAWKYILAGGFMLGISDVTIFLALDIVENISLVLAVATISSILTIFGGIFILGERRYARAKITAGIMATAGLVLIV